MILKTKGEWKGKDERKKMAKRLSLGWSGINKETEFTKELIRTIFEGYGCYVPNVVMDSKPGKAYIEFLTFTWAKKAYDEISEEKNAFKLKLVTEDKSGDKPTHKQQKVCEVDRILGEAGITTSESGLETNKPTSLDDMEALLMAKIKAKSKQK